MAIRINRVYTRTGDKGQTRLVGGKAVAKDSLRVEAYGAVDELNSILGLARSFNERDLSGRGQGRKARTAMRELDDTLKRLQNELFDLGSELATPKGGEYPGMFKVGKPEIEALEACIDRCQDDLEPLQSFILPGGGPTGAFLHQARTVCRRAERDVLRLARKEKLGDGPLRYLNRLSDLLFVLSRWVALHTGSPEYLWERGLHLGAKPAGTKKKPSPRKKATPSKSGRAPARKTRSAAGTRRKKESRS